MLPPPGEDAIPEISTATYADAMLGRLRVLAAGSTQLRMVYQSHVLPGLYALKWGDRPDAADMYSLARELATAHKSQGEKLFALFIVPESSSVPDDSARKAQAACLPEMFQHAAHAVAVFEGCGFTPALKRSALTAILHLGRSRYPMTMRSSVEEALLTRPPPQMQLDGRATLAALKECGFA